MNKSQLVNEVASKTELSKKDAEAAVNALFEVITEALGNQEKVSIVGFGNFEAKKRAARKGRNPQDGSEVNIPERIVPAFKAGKQLKDAVTGK